MKDSQKSTKDATASDVEAIVSGVTPYQRNVLLDGLDDDEGFAICASERSKNCLVRKGLVNYSYGFGHKYGGPLVELTELGKQVAEALPH